MAFTNINFELLRWWQQSAEQGDADAQFNLGVCLENGMAEDKKLAAEWYRKAAEQGHASAQFKLGICLENGAGVTEDKKAAVEWYRKAAEQGHADAQFNLGLCLEYGEGATVDRKTAAEWYQRAADQGHYDAMLRHILVLIAVKQNEQLALVWCNKYASRYSDKISDGRDKIVKCITTETARDLLKLLERSRTDDEDTSLYLKDNGKTIVFCNLVPETIDNELGIITFVLDHYPKISSLEIEETKARECEQEYPPDGFVEHRLGPKLLASFLKMLQFRCKNILSFSFEGLGSLVYSADSCIDAGYDDDKMEYWQEATEIVFPELLKLLSGMPKLINLELKRLGHFFICCSEEDAIKFSKYLLESRIKKLNFADAHFNIHVPCETPWCPEPLEEFRPIKTILSGIEKSKTITELDLSNVAGVITEYEFQRGICFYEELLGCILQIIANNQTIKILKLDQLAVTQQYLWDGDLQERRVQFLRKMSEALKQNKSLTNLHWCDCSPELIKYIERDDYDLSNYSFATEMMPTIFGHPTLQGLRLGDWDFLYYAPKHFQSLLALIPNSFLRSLDFGHLNTESLQYEQFSKMLLSNKCVSHLSLDLEGFAAEVRISKEKQELQSISSSSPLFTQLATAFNKTLIHLRQNKYLHALEIRIDLNEFPENLCDVFQDFLSQNQGLQSLTLHTGDIRCLDVDRFKKLFRAIFANPTLDTLKLCRTRKTDLTLFQFQVLNELMPHKDDASPLMNLQFLGPDLSYHRPKSQEWVNCLSNLAMRRGLLKASDPIVSCTSKLHTLTNALISHILSFMASPTHEYSKTLCWQAPSVSRTMQQALITKRAIKEAQKKQKM